eukprot:scaffold183013_cov14-Tisochrysis_lutea.AAC.1
MLIAALLPSLQPLTLMPAYPMMAAAEVMVLHPPTIMMAMMVAVLLEQISSDTYSSSLDDACHAMHSPLLSRQFVLPSDT